MKAWSIIPALHDYCNHCYHHYYFYHHTVFSRLDAAVFIEFLMIRGQCLFINHFTQTDFEIAK